MDFVNRSEFIASLSDLKYKKCWSATLGICNALLLCFGDKVPRRVSLPKNRAIVPEILDFMGEYEIVTNLAFWRLSEISLPSFNQTILEDETEDVKETARDWLDRLEGATVSDVIFYEPYLDVKIVFLDVAGRTIYLDVFCIADKEEDRTDAFHYFFPKVLGGYTVRFDGSIIIGRT